MGSAPHTNREDARWGEVVFRKAQGYAVPMQPWPQSFYVSRTMLYTDAIEVRPLTVTGLLKGVGRNFVTMNWWRLCWIARGLGFLKTQENCSYHWRDLTLRLWRYQQLRRFRWVRWALRTAPRVPAFFAERANQVIRRGHRNRRRTR